MENFIGDLVGGTYSNGSAEREYADNWFNRCWFAMFPEDSLLNYLLEFGYSPEHYISILENIQEAEADKSRADEHPEDYDEVDIFFLMMICKVGEKNLMICWKIGSRRKKQI